MGIIFWGCFFCDVCEQKWGGRDGAGIPALTGQVYHCFVCAEKIRGTVDVPHHREEVEPDEGVSVLWVRMEDKYEMWKVLWTNTEPHVSI